MSQFDALFRDVNGAYTRRSKVVLLCVVTAFMVAIIMCPVSTRLYRLIRPEYHSVSNNKISKEDWFYTPIKKMIHKQPENACTLAESSNMHVKLECSQ